MTNPSFCTLLHRSEVPTLNAVQTTLRDALTKIYDTRYKQICPPAYAGFVLTSDLQVEELGDTAPSTSLVVFAPADFEPHVCGFSMAAPRVLVHPDTGLLSQGAYVAWSAPAPAGQIPLSLWLEAEQIVEAIDENEALDGASELPIVLVAGDTVTVTSIAPDADQLKRYRNAILAAKTPPKVQDTQTLEKAKRTALSYGQRPWLFMRYELRTVSGRLAVSWAPMGRTGSGRGSH
jgi:hypothetical protein